MKFSDTKRSPTIPLSFESKVLSRAKEFIIDYINYTAYIKTTDGSFVNVSKSESALKELGDYLLNNPTVITDIKIVTNNGENTIQETFAELRNRILVLRDKTYGYAGSDTNSGAANSAERLAGILTIKNMDGTNTTYNGSSDISVDLSNIYMTSGGHISGDVIMKKRLILKEGEMYGTKLPDTGVDGQIFILLDDV